MTKENDGDTSISEKRQPEGNGYKKQLGSLSNQMFSIRLSIPKIWIEDLDRLRRFNHTTRLALLRRFIQEKMQQELPVLNQPKKQPLSTQQQISLYPPQPRKWGQQ